MSASGWFGCSVLEAPEADTALLAEVHSERYVEGLRAICERGGAQIDADTIALPGTWEAALRAAGGAVALVDALLGDGERAGVSALRPPGHHAERERAMGFCFFGNVAAAALRARQAHGAERVLILDWDVHHGNGTNDIFHADPGVLFMSIHESPLYPGTGPASDVGSGPGEGFTVNVPVPGGHRRRRLPLAGRARHVRADRGMGAAARARLRGLRRAPRRPARRLLRDRGGLRGHDRLAAAGGRRRRRAAGAGARGRLRHRRAVALDGGADAGAGRGVHARAPRRSSTIRSPPPRWSGSRRRRGRGWLLLLRDDAAGRAAAGAVAHLRERLLGEGAARVLAAEDHEGVGAEGLEVVGVEHADARGPAWRRARWRAARRPRACRSS